MKLKNLPLKTQILLAPAVTIFLIMGLIGFTLAKLYDIKHQNEVVRDWVLICTHAQGAISAGQRMDTLAKEMETGKTDKDDDLHFSYLEQSRALVDHLSYPDLYSKLSPETRAYLQREEQLVRYRDQLNPVAVRRTMSNLLPRLEELYRGFYVQKRSAYTDYYDNVNDITSQLVSISLSVLALSAFTGIALSIWTIRNTKGRLGTLARDARKICAGDLVTPHPPEKVRDEVDELAFCMSTMTQRLLNVVATEKVLEGAEEERKRIAMDIHDQTLSDLTNLSRSLQTLRDHPESAPEHQTARLQELSAQVEEIANGMRRIIDDLHPQTLDLLGLEKALRSYLAKRLTGADLPDYFLHIDSDVDDALSDFQRLSLYRIVLEGVNNVVRHAQCTRYEVECRRTNGAITVIIEDNGSGFDYRTARRGGGHGLPNIEERAKAIGASVRWGPSRFTSGTRFELKLETRPSEHV
ncbi:MAG: histidine kinase [Gammaproteobacteria bacterium]